MSEQNTRTQDEINQDYSRYALAYGDRILKLQLAQNEIEQIRKKLLELVKEKSQASAPVVDAPSQA